MLKTERYKVASELEEIAQTWVLEVSHDLVFLSSILRILISEHE